LQFVPQEARTIEELMMQRFERERAKQYFLHVSRVCKEASQVQQEAAEELQASVEESITVDGPGCTSALKHVLQQSAMHGALAVLLSRNAAKHQQWYQQALDSFAKLTA
jgi:hypothetical protein